MESASAGLRSLADAVIFTFHGSRFITAEPFFALAGVAKNAWQKGGFS